MKNVLLPSHRGIVEQFAGSNVLLAFDFDGTLAPIVAFPERAGLRRATSELLEDLTSLYPCVVISGRARADVLERLRGIPVHGVIGNHGLEPWGASERLREEVGRWRLLLEKELSSVRGVKIEDKAFSIAVHYRQAPEKEKARAAIVKAAAALDDVRIIGGARVVNILPHGGPHKGTALEREVARLGCEAAIYVGDDETDEDVFSLGPPARILTIRIGASPVSVASYYLPSQADIDELLRLLVVARRRAVGLR